MTPKITPPRDAFAGLVLVTGPSGAGRTTAINVLEDLGFEVINNLPLSLLPRLLDGPPLSHPLALGLDIRNRDFSIDALISAIDGMTNRPDIATQVLYLDASEEELVRRFSETRRRHPLVESGSLLSGISREKELLVPIRARADVLIETTGLSPHDLRAEIERLFAPDEGHMMNVTVHSFSYKRGLPRGMDIVLDCRFLRNPHWDAALRDHDGRDAAVDAYVEADPRFTQFFAQIKDMMDLLLPAYKEEGKSHLSIGFGCTGGQHRSVAVAERLAKSLAADGWQVSKRHREMERRDAQASGKRG
ncbi:MAG: RNase adapter RapZ [Loktanella sp.]|nr:RNase adapter RapZ [Loktanella sp.]MDO7609069.1 RNase adapter RapZ [Loktanella sp.]MDO7623383.1 RNase adapter RapZ [Loktanella sp.]MDO7627187.1 RNase adapter RapZ [Loktanella sp.]MDO7665110.1 RNase adapter RapZ [Loktanella sp.]